MQAPAGRCARGRGVWEGSVLTGDAQMSAYLTWGDTRGVLELSTTREVCQAHLVILAHLKCTN